MARAQCFNRGSVTAQCFNTEFQVGGFRLNFMQELGRGGFGTVYKGYSQSGRVAAIKKVSKKDRRKAATEAVRFHYLKETIVHRNVVSVFFKNYGQTLLQSIEDKVVLMKQIANGVAFLHSKDIVHRDIKPGNALLKLSPDIHAIVKLGDFGLSKILDPEALTSTMSSNVGTLHFQAPEFWDKQPPNNRIRYHRNIDVYSMGLTFAAMLQAEPGRKLAPREDCSMDTAHMRTPIGMLAYTRMKNGFPAVNVVEDKANDNDITKHTKHVVRQMTQPEADNRPTVDSVCSALTDLVRTGI